MARGSVAAEGPERLRSVRVALAVSLALFLAKLAAYFATGFVVMLAEAVHSATDALQTGFLWVAARLSASPPDEAHPYGHGRGENLAAVVASMVVVFFVAAGLVREALGELRGPREAPAQPLLALGVLGASALLMLWPLVLARRDMHKHGGVVRAQAMEGLNDLLGVLAAMAGVGLVLLGYAQADALAALAVAGIIVYNAIRLFLANMPFLVGGSPPQEFYQKVAAAAAKVQGTLGVHSLAAEYIGPTQVHLDLHLTVPPGMNVEEADRLAHEVRHRLREELDVRHATIHFCPSSGALRSVGDGPQGHVGALTALRAPGPVPRKRGRRRSP